MKVSLQAITKHGKKQTQKYRDKVEGEMACPQCGYSQDDALQKYPDALAFMLIKLYPSIEFQDSRQTDMEYRCNKCDAEWIIHIEEDK